jgi:hypothetical protein
LRTMLRGVITAAGGRAAYHEATERCCDEGAR